MLRLTALGGLALLKDDAPLVGSAARGRNLALLALLARAGGGGMSREKLAVLLWPESDAERARHSLDQALYTLRRTLGPDSLVTGGTSIALNPDVVPSDVAEFAAASASGDDQRAMSLYTGEFLDGFHLSDSAEFERWVDVERAQLHNHFIAALESLAQEAATTGDTAGAVAYWRRLAAIERLSSRVALSLMRALDTAGDRAGALQFARVHEAVVRAELDVPPDQSVLAYVDDLKRESKATGVPPASAPASAPLATPTRSARSVSSDPPFASHPYRRSRRLAAWMGLAAAAAGVLTVAAQFSTGDASPGSASPRVMVAAFANETADVALDPIGRMAADWITEGLVRTGLVQVLERDIGAPADALISGRVYQAGDSIWLQARITQPGDGTVLRALDAVGTAGTHPSAALESLRQRVLGAMGILYDPRLTGYASATLRPPSFDAYREFAAGMEAFSFPRDLDGAADRFLRAAELDPDYTLPRLWLAWTWLMANEHARADSVAHMLHTAREGMSPWERAWHDRISADLAGDRQAAFRAAQRMVEVAPRSAAVIALANAAVDLNRPGLAVAAILDAGIENLAPEQEYPWFILTSSYHTLGQYQMELEATEQAIEQVGLAWGFVGPGVPALAALGRFDELEQRLNELRSVALEEGLPGGPTSVQTAVIELRTHGFGDAAHTVLNRTLNDRWGFPDDGSGSPGIQLIRMRVHYELGNWAEAERALVGVPSNGVAGMERAGMAGLLAARRGDRAGAEEVLEELSKLDRPYLFGEHTFWRARIESVLGNHERAIDLLRQAFAEGQWARAWYGVQHLRDFDPLRELPSFRAFAAPQ